VNHSAALESAIKTGADRILTSGGAPTAMEGAKAIARLVVASGERVTIMACGKIRESNVRSLLSATGVREVHANLQSPLNSEQRGSSVEKAATVESETVARFLAAVVRKI
jgi:copper homeostasis protein